MSGLHNRYEPASPQHSHRSVPVNGQPFPPNGMRQTVSEGNATAWAQVRRNRQRRFYKEAAAAVVRLVHGDESGHYSDPYEVRQEGLRIGVEILQAIVNKQQEWLDRESGEQDRYAFSAPPGLEASNKLRITLPTTKDRESVPQSVSGSEKYSRSSSSGREAPPCNADIYQSKRHTAKRVIKCKDNPAENRAELAEAELLTSLL